MDLKMEVTQTLGLSQRMIQSTEILQMSAQELDTYLKELAVENPVVDIEEKFDKSRESERDAELQKKLEWLASSDEQNIIRRNTVATRMTTRICGMSVTTEGKIWRST